MIFTFYSYKGGVGRSMALANIAHLMCDCGLNVLVVDWDLEAPGLERFLFDEPRDIENALQQKGLLDLLLDYKDALLNFRPEAKKPFFPPYSISDYIVPVPIIDSTKSRQNSLSLLPAGERGNEQFTEYSNKVKSFDWQDFYQKWKGEKYFEWLRKELEKLSDVVLIDSRTGVTEMGGVCTYQMADTIIMFSSTNDQSIDGTLRMLQSFSDPELPDLRNGRRLTTIVIPSRVEQTSEIQILNIYREKFSQTFNKHLPDELKSKFDFFLKGKNEIPYFPRYSFGELVAVKQTNTDLQAPQLEEAYKKLLITLSKITPQDSILRRKIHEEDKITEVSETKLHFATSKPTLFKTPVTVDEISESETLKDHYESLIEAIIRGRIVPFLGSDINLCDRILQGNGKLKPWKPDCQYPPSGKELATYLATTFPPRVESIIYPKTGELPKGSPLINQVIHEQAIVIYLDSIEQGSLLHVGGGSLQYLSQYAYLTQEKEFYDQLEKVKLGCQPNKLHKFFATLPAIMRKKGYYPPYPLIVTTNYDCALERAFEEAGETFDLVFYSNTIDAKEQDKFVHQTSDGDLHEILTPNEYKGLSFNERPVILKLYGTVEQIQEGESLVITEEHYINYLVSRNLSNLLPAELLKKLRFPKPNILFLGYPLGDWNQRIILHRIWHNLTSKKRYPWWAIQSNTEPLARKFWESYQVVSHDVPLSDYISELEQRVRDIPARGDKVYE